MLGTTIDGATGWLNSAPLTADDLARKRLTFEITFLDSGVEAYAFTFG